MANTDKRGRAARRPELTFGGAWEYASAPESTDHVDLADRYDLFVGGSFVRPKSRKYFATTNPATEQRLCCLLYTSPSPRDRG